MRTLYDVCPDSASDYPPLLPPAERGLDANVQGQFKRLTARHEVNG